MAITLGALREYCSEVASTNQSGSTAERTFAKWINEGLKRVWSEHSWDHIRAKAKVYMDPEETGADMDLTQGSLAIEVGGAETIATKYPVTEEAWTLIVTSESMLTFKLATRDTATTGTLAAGNNWTNATVAGSDYTWVRDTFPLPDNAKQIYRVHALQTSQELEGLGNDEFDARRQAIPALKGTHPEFYTLRGGNLEVWPPAGDTARTLEVTYRKGAPTYASDAADAVEVDWPEEWEDLLKKAVLLEAALVQGENSPVPYPLAKNEYLDLVMRYRGLDSKKDQASGPMGASSLVPGRRLGRFAFRGGSHTDNG